MNLKSSFLIVLILFIVSCSAKPTVISYPSTNNQILSADLFLPEQKPAAPLPLVIVIHGGGWSNRTGDMENICHKLTKNGFAALNITYRFAPAYHHPVQVNDVKAVIPWLTENAEKFNLDKNNISVWGYSAGAHLGFILANQKDLNLKIKSVVVGGIPSYFPYYPESPLITKYMGMKFYDNPKAWQEASPTSFVSESSPPTFIYHGRDDSLVGIKQAQILDAKLTEAKVKHEFLTIPNRGHFSLYFFGSDTEDKAIDFIKSISP